MTHGLNVHWSVPRSSSEREGESRRSLPTSLQGRVAPTHASDHVRLRLAQTPRPLPLVSFPSSSFQYVPPARELRGILPGLRQPMARQYNPPRRFSPEVT